MQVESRATPLLTTDEVEKSCFIGHVFQLTYAAMVDKLIQQEKLNHCHGCAIQQPSQNQHSCLMMDNDGAWMYYHDEQIDLNSLLNATESICSALGFKLGKSWEAYVTKLSKMPWTSIYLASLELDVVQQGEDLQSRILYALYYGPNGLKWKDFGHQQETIGYPERVVRKDEQPMDLDLIINDVQNRLGF